MGQRSQIYIRYKDKKGIQLIARYFGWNYGERMVSRTRGIIEWLDEYKDSFEWLFNDNTKMLALQRVCDVNFDMRDVLISTCIKEEIREQFPEEVEHEGLASYLFGQDNNDGQLLIDVSSGTIKYAFIPYYTEAEKVMSASTYMEWNRGKSWHAEFERRESLKEAADYTLKNIRYISNHARLMTAKEVAEFLAYDYTCAVFGYPF